MGSTLIDEYVKMVEARAVAASRGKMSTVRQQNTKSSNLVRDALRQVAGGGSA